MLFLEPWFWTFAAVAVTGFLLLPQALRVWWLLATSLTFYFHFGGVGGVLVVTTLATLSWAAALTSTRVGRWSLPAFAICLCVATLVTYKYSNLVRDTFIHLAVWTGTDPPRPLLGWMGPAAPLGISFFTFEFVHYLYEVRVTGRQPVRNPLHFAVFAFFFPTLAAGPIKRFPDFVPQLATLARPSPDVFWSGVRRVVLGLFKKVCVADLIVEWVKLIEQQTSPTSGLVAMLAVLQGLRIYYDFDGYSDMAIGLAGTLGLRVPENFDRPYGATSLRDFWRRWHMSLSSWIRDYVYVPLGGNRRHRAFNLLTAMAVCGLWHGAAWHFAVWGVYHGAGLAGEAALRRTRPGLFADGPVRNRLRQAVCFGFVSYGWLIFFYPPRVVLHQTATLLTLG